MKRGKEGGNGGSDTRRGGGRVGQREGNKGRKAAGRAFKKKCTLCCVRVHVHSMHGPKLLYPCYYSGGKKEEKINKRGGREAGGRKRRGKG